MVKCFLSEAGLQGNDSVTAFFCYIPAHTLARKRGKSLEVLEPNSHSDKTPTYELWVKPINNKLPARPRTATAISLLSVQPQTNIAPVGSAKAKQLWSLCLLIWKWSLSLISISRWLGFKDLASYLSCISQKKHCQCVVRVSCVGMDCKLMPVWSCLDNLARLRPRNPQSRLNIETLKPHRLSRSGMNGQITDRDYLDPSLAGHFEQNPECPVLSLCHT